MTTDFQTLHTIPRALCKCNDTSLPEAVQHMTG
jgi:hypothetical protein